VDQEEVKLYLRVRVRDCLLSDQVLKLNNFKGGLLKVQSSTSTLVPIDAERIDSKVTLLGQGII
jgi:hypothetical protein